MALYKGSVKLAGLGGNGVEITEVPDDYSAMRGPCAEGFHIPTKDEWGTVYNIGIDIGAWLSNGGPALRTYLKIPLTGLIPGSSGTYGNSGPMTRLWTSTAYSDTSPSGYNVGLRETKINIPAVDEKTGGFSIRPFKDTPVTPDSTWTVLYQGTGDAGIYHNSILGLISLSSDGTNWITIADKNLGATTVFNYGDTLAESNCGKFYQRGNNYGFTRGVSPTNKSTTPIDASSYGPGNYFSSDTFIYVNSSPYTWDTSKNPNLRGGETGMIPAHEEAVAGGVELAVKDYVDDMLGDVTTLLDNI